MSYWSFTLDELSSWISEIEKTNKCKIVSILINRQTLKTFKENNKKKYGGKIHDKLWGITLSGNRKESSFHILLRTSEKTLFTICMLERTTGNCAECATRQVMES